MRTDATPERVAARLHQHYVEWFIGDGATTEFHLAHTLGRLEDVTVLVDGALKRPSSAGTAYDYKVRGLTPGYDGDKNAIKFAAAPANTKNICVQVVST